MGPKLFLRLKASSLSAQNMTVLFTALPPKLYDVRIVLNGEDLYI